MPDFDMTIDGKAVAGAGRFGVINPSTGEVFAEAPDASRAQLENSPSEMCVATAGSVTVTGTCRSVCVPSPS